MKYRVELTLPVWGGSASTHVMNVEATKVVVVDGVLAVENAETGESRLLAPGQWARVHAVEVRP